jgi:type IV pilus biogenesis protein CpaD/CtpE
MMKTLQVTTLLVLTGVQIACVEQAPRFEAEFGNATRATLNAQIINPDAGNNPDPVAGLDGRAARDAINNYQKSFAQPEPTPNVFNIGVGNNNSGSGGK